VSPRSDQGNTQHQGDRDVENRWNVGHEIFERAPQCFGAGMHKERAGEGDKERSEERS